MSDIGSAEEFVQSLNGFEEIAIRVNFGSEWGSLAEQSPTTLTRALVFIHLKRQGVTDEQAKQQVMAMPLSEITSYFETPIEEIDPDEPETEQGKGDSLNVT